VILKALTRIELELLQNYDQLLMIESGIRGGVCQVSHRFAEANNKHMKSYIPEEPSRTLIMRMPTTNMDGKYVILYHMEDLNGCLQMI
jgi:hypothetical protein